MSTTGNGFGEGVFCLFVALKIIRYIMLSFVWYRVRKMVCVYVHLLCDFLVESRGVKRL